MTLKDIFHKIIGRGDLVGKEREFATEVNQELVNLHKADLQQIASLKAQVSMYKAKEYNPKNEEKKEKEREEKIIKLEEEQEKIDRNKFGDMASLRKLFEISDNNKVVVTTYDDSKVLGDFYDIAIDQKEGRMILFNKQKNPLASGYGISDIIWKPDTLMNQIKFKKISIPRDKNMNFVEDIDNMKFGDIIYDEEEPVTDDNGNEILDREGNKIRGVYRQSEFYKKKLRELLIEKENKMKELIDRNEILENAQVHLNRKLNDLNSTLNVLKNGENISKSNLSLAVNTHNQAMKNIGELQRSNSLLTQLKVQYETEMSMLKSTIEKLLNKIGELSGESIRDQVEEEMFEKLERCKNILPETIINEAPEQKQERVILNPGDKLPLNSGKVR